RLRRDRRWPAGASPLSDRRPGARADRLGADGRVDAAVRKWTIYVCPCGYRDVRPGNCRSHPMPCRAMGPPMEPVEVVAVADVETTLQCEQERYEVADPTRAEGIASALFVFRVGAGMKG